MDKSIKDMTPDELKSLIQETVRNTIEDMLEDLQALSSPEYLHSIKEAREDYRSGNSKSIEEVEGD